MVGKYRGSALITALFIMTLVAIAATAMSTRLQLDIYRTRLTLTSDKLYLASQGVTFWAMNLLSKKSIYQLLDEQTGKIADYPAKLQEAYPGVISKGALYDMQALFNLNSLLDPKSHLLFYNLLKNVLKSNSSTDQKRLIRSIYQWIIPYQPGHGQDKELNFYLNQKPAYLPGYQPLKSTSELRIIQGINTNKYQALLPFITVLPEKTLININTAPKIILMSLGDGLSETEVDEIIQERSKKIKHLNDISPLLQKLDIPTDQITIESHYFLSVATVSLDNLNLTTYTILKRGENNKITPPSISIVSEHLNTR